MIRVMLVDDSALVRQALRLFLRSAEGLAVVGECADGAEVLATAAEVDPDVVLMDVDMPIMMGLEATRQLLAVRPAVRVLILTAGSAVVEPLHAADAGAVGFLTKSGRSAEHLVEAIRTVAAGGTAWPSSDDLHG